MEYIKSVNGHSNDVSIFDEARSERLLRRQFLTAPSFEFYGGIAGLLDMRSSECVVKVNFITSWKPNFNVREIVFDMRNHA